MRECIQLRLHLRDPFELDVERFGDLGDDAAALVEEVDEAVVFGARDVEALRARDAWNAPRRGLSFSHRCSEL